MSELSPNATSREYTDAEMRDAVADLIVAMRQRLKDAVSNGAPNFGLLADCEALLASCAPSTRRAVVHGKVVAAFIAPDSQQWQSSTVNVTEDGTWWRWDGKKWLRDTLSIAEAQ